MAPITERRRSRMEREILSQKRITITKLKKQQRERAVLNDDGNQTNNKGLLQCFYSSTPFHGFGFIRQSGSMVEKIIWHLLIIAFFLITISEVMKLAKQYINRSPVTTVTMMFNQSIHFPDATLCLPFNYKAQFGKIFLYASVEMYLKSPFIII